MDAEQVDEWGRLFALILARREGRATKDQTDEAVKNILDRIAEGRSAQAQQATATTGSRPSAPALAAHRARVGDDQ